MPKEVAELIGAIAAFQAPPDEDETETVSRLYALLDRAEELPAFESAGEPLFRLLERHADRNLGNPGPVVHALETLAECPALLSESLRRKPTYYTVWMVNRILNTDLSAPKRSRWLLELAAARDHPKADQAAVGQADSFIEYQASREG